MNNSLINRNTTVLVLIILILGFIFMNLENNKSMTGGDVDCELYIPIVKKLMEKDWLYSYTIGSWPGYIIYIILILVLLYFGFAFGKYQVFMEGLNLPNSSPGGLTILDWAKVGLFKFYTVRNDTYFYKNSAGSGTTNPLDKEEFTNLVVELSTPAYKPTVHNFCEAIQPCKNITPCACKGSINCNTNIVQKFKNVNIEHLGQELTLADKDLLNKAESLKYFFGILPKCCCLYQTKYTPAAGLKAGQDNPNHKYLTQIPVVCSDGKETASGVTNALNTPGTTLKKLSDNPVDIGTSNPEDECKDIDCSNEPDYEILSKPAFDANDNLTPEYAERSNNIIKNIAQSTPASTFIAAYHGSSYNTPSNLNKESFGNFAKSDPSKFQNIQNIFVSGNFMATPGLDKLGGSPPISNPLSDVLGKQLSKPFDPKTNLASKSKVPPVKSILSISKFTSDVPKSAKKIKKNKK